MGLRTNPMETHWKCIVIILSLQLNLEAYQLAKVNECHINFYYSNSNLHILQQHYFLYETTF